MSALWGADRGGLSGRSAVRLVALPADAAEASVFRIVGHWLAPHRPDAARMLLDSGIAYFAAKGETPASAEALLASGVLIGLSRFRDQVFRALGTGP